MMKRINYLYIFSMAAILTMAACSKENEETQETVSINQTWKAVVEAKKGDGALTRALQENSDGSLTGMWNKSDIVYVMKDGVNVGTLSPESNGETSYLTGKLTGSFAVGDELVLKTIGPTRDYTGQIGTLEDIAKKYDYATASVTVRTIDSKGNAVDLGEAYFHGEQFIVKINFNMQVSKVYVIAPDLLLDEENTGALLITPLTPTNTLYVAMVQRKAIPERSYMFYVPVSNSTVYVGAKPDISACNGSNYTADVTLERYEDAVDMGLSVKWGTSNLWADSPTDDGGFFAWGELAPKTSFSESNYKFYRDDGDGTKAGYTKYVNSNSNGIYNGYHNYVDGLTALESEDDAATSAKGVGWRLPNSSEAYELMNANNCEFIWTNLEGKTGMIIRSQKEGFTDKFIFLPAAGFYNSIEQENGSYSVVLQEKNESASFWVSELDAYSADMMRCYKAQESSRPRFWLQRNYGNTIRPVKEY